MKLFCQAFLKLALGFLVLFVLLFTPAGSLHYWQGWLFMGILFIPTFVVGLVMFFCAPDLLRKRLNSREEEAEQRKVVAASVLMFLVGFVLAGLGYRFEWIHFPWWVSIVGTIMFLGAYALYAEVLRENAYLSRTVEVQEGQQVIDTGLYSVVRHPMYSATLVLFLAIPFVLGSPFALIAFLSYLPIIVARIRNEEAVLEKGLPGYEDYEGRVRWRLIPRIW